MPRRSSIPSDPKGLLDSWGRANRSIPDKKCAHCGATFRPARSSSAYCSVPCARKKNGGHNKKDGGTWWVTSRGYVQGRLDGMHVKKHRLVAEKAIGRALLPNEDVHHKNGDKTDNRPENLEVVNHASHTRLHNSERTYRRGYKLSLAAEERADRSERMRQMRRAAIAKATGAT